MIFIKTIESKPRYGTQILKKKKKLKRKKHLIVAGKKKKAFPKKNFQCSVNKVAML